MLVLFYMLFLEAYSKVFMGPNFLPCTNQLLLLENLDRLLFTCLNLVDCVLLVCVFRNEEDKVIC